MFLAVPGPRVKGYSRPVFATNLERDPTSVWEKSFFFLSREETSVMFHTGALVCRAHSRHDVSAVARAYAVNGKLAMLRVVCAELRLASAPPSLILVLLLASRFFAWAADRFAMG